MLPVWPADLKNIKKGSGCAVAAAAQPRRNGRGAVRGAMAGGARHLEFKCKAAGLSISLSSLAYRYNGIDICHDIVTDIIMIT